MVGPRSPFPLRYLDEAVGFLVPRSQVSFPVPRPRPTFRSFVPPFFVPCSQIYHNSKLSVPHAVEHFPGNIRGVATGGPALERNRCICRGEFVLQPWQFHFLD